jgi:putative ABC transport system ATP-binding protein
MSSIIQLKEVSKIYGFGDATTVALEEVSLSVGKNEFIAIMGPSGSGKTTLLNMIGLLDHPSHGVYRIEGKSVERLKPNTRAKIRRDKIGFVFQSFSLLPKMTVIENVALPLAYKGMTFARRTRAAAKMLEHVGLADRAYFYPHQLSGGQTQRSTIARALVNDPKIIIADEPTGNLDSNSSRIVMELLADIHKTGNTVMLVTHNPELTRYASRVLYMYDGMVVHDEKTKIGVVSKRAQQTVVFVPRPSEEEDLMGVSAMMGAIPKHGDDKPRQRKIKSQRKPRRKIVKKRRKTVKAK